MSPAPACTAPVAEPALDALTMRRAMGRFATGVAVVTTSVDGTPHGMTVNSLTSVSLDPPLLLVCLTVGARSTEAVSRSGRYAVNVLSARQEPLALRFARRGADHFAGLEVTYGRHRVPIIPDALAHLECEVEREVPAGDHQVVIGRVRGICARDGEPLGFHGGQFGDVLVRGQERPLWFG